MREFRLGGSAPFTPFGWKGPVSAEEQLSVDFTTSLPPSPLRAHLASLMALYVHEQNLYLTNLKSSRPSGDILVAGEEARMAERLAVFEQHLREIATFTQLDPVRARRIVENATKPKAPRVRREFKRKDQ